MGLDPQEEWDQYDIADLERDPAVNDPEPEPGDGLSGSADPRPGTKPKGCLWSLILGG